MTKRHLVVFIIAAIVTLIAVLLFVNGVLLGTRIRPAGGRAVILIPEGASYTQVMDSLQANLEISSIRVLEWFAKKKNYPALVKSGRYVFERPVGYNELVNILRSGKQTPVMVTFSNVRTVNDLAGRVGGQIEADSAGIMAFLSDPANYSQDGFSRETVISAFIPDSYEFYWNTGPGKFYSRMLAEYRKFWNDERTEKCETIGLTPIEVSVLASIVESEVKMADEMPRIAGVYLNRLRNGIPLQADPTIKFAIDDFTVTRILYKHLETDSPYNTYKYKGLPPGPVSCPSPGSIDAVLNAERHDYLYFAAKADFSGYHNFSRTLAEHNLYANQYRRELNKRRIFR